MRTDVPDYLDDLWQGGTFTGARKAMARVVVQHMDVALENVGYNLYASLVFGNQLRSPKEAPNVQSVSWQRSVDTEIATCTVTFYNTVEVPLGTEFVPDFTKDVRGYYTFDRGTTSFSPRWDATPNEWQGLLVPDNILYTYEGYGFDPESIPEKDANLMQTGMWIIDSVEYATNGIITVKCSDLLRILRDQVAFVPVIPSNFYPLQFSFDPKAVGTSQGFGYQGSAQGYPPGGQAINSLGTTGGDGTVDLTWTIDTFEIDPSTVYGYQVVIDDQVQENIIYPGMSTTIRHLLNGNVYSFQVIPLYKNTVLLESLSAKVTAASNALIGLDVNSKAYYDGLAVLNAARAAYNREAARPPKLTAGAVNDSLRIAGHPRSSAMAHTDLNSVFINAGPPTTSGGPPTDVLGDICFSYTGTPVSFDIVVLLNGHKYVFHGNPADHQALATGIGLVISTGLGDLTGASVLVYPICSDGIGFGDVYYPDGTFVTFHGKISPPAVGQPPSPASPGYGSTVGNTATGRVKPLSTITKSLTFSADSGEYGITHTVVGGETLFDLAATYLGSGTKADVIYLANQEVIDAGAIAHGQDISTKPIYTGEVLTISTANGHSPGDAFDGNDATYWLSEGCTDPTQADSYVWIEGSCDGEEIVAVSWRTIKDDYQVYVSVFAEGHWIQLRPGEVVPYVASTVAKDNGARVPYVTTAAQGDAEGVWTSTFLRPIPGATKVRLSFTNLTQFDVGDPGGGDLLYRAGVREFNIITVPVTNKLPGLKTVSSTTAYSNNSPTSTFVSGYTTSAGATPGIYGDYTDIVKLFCAWGGFFWAPGAGRVLSDSTTQEYAFDSFDGVLGSGAGRVWGDFMQTGTAGIAALPIPQWDKKSLLDCINVVQQIIGFLFYCDELGSIVWRLPNVYSVGNYVGDNASGSAYDPSQIVSIDENNTLIDLQSTLDATNLRERFFVATVDGTIGGLSQGYNPNPIGLRRVAGWLDQHFASSAEAQLMADFIAIRALMAYRQDTLTIPGYPRIQIDDQVRIFEQITNEGYLHYVRGISSNLNLETGEYTYQLTTNWLGSDPFDQWIFDPGLMSTELQQYLNAILSGNGQYPSSQAVTQPGVATGQGTATGPGRRTPPRRVGYGDAVLIDPGLTYQEFEHET